MKFPKHTTPKGAFIPAAALKISHIPCGEAAEMHTLDNVLVLMKGRMSAPELLTVVRQLSGLAEGLIVHLAGICGPCSDCGENCPGDDLDSEDIGLPEYLRKEAGIPDGAKLCAEIDREAGTVTISASGHRYDLRDVPEGLLNTFMEAGACLGALEKHMILEDIVYGR